MSRGLSLAGCHEVFSIPGLRPCPLPATLSGAAGGHHEGDPRDDPQFRKPSWLCGGVLDLTREAILDSPATHTHGRAEIRLALSKGGARARMCR